MKFNKGLELPDPANSDHEAIIQFQKQKTMKAASGYIKKHCDPKGNIEGGSNMTEAEYRGYKEVQEGVKNSEWVLYQTDKSGMMCLDTIENYKKAMQVHIEKDQEISRKSILNAEQRLNEHSRMWSKMLNLGVESGQEVRCKETLVTTYNPVPVLSGLRKDHKVKTAGENLLRAFSHLACLVQLT